MKIKIYGDLNDSGEMEWWWQSKWYKSLYINHKKNDVIENVKNLFGKNLKEVRVIDLRLKRYARKNKSKD